MSVRENLRPRGAGWHTLLAPVTDLYERRHALLRGLLDRVPGLSGSDFTAHALLAATRADLVEHLAGRKAVPRAELREQPAKSTAAVLGPGT